MIAIHVLASPVERESESYARLIGQLQAEPVALYPLPAIPGGTLQARADGYAAGSAPWCGSCDPDDAIVPGSFARILSALEAYPDSTWVGTAETLVFPPPCRPSAPPGSIRAAALPLNRLHHLSLFRRDLLDIERFLATPPGVGEEIVHCVDYLIRYCTQEAPGLYLDFPCYLWAVGNPDSYSAPAPAGGDRGRPRLNMTRPHYDLAQHRPVLRVLSEADFAGADLIGAGALWRPRPSR